MNLNWVRKHIIIIETFGAHWVWIPTTNRNNDVILELRVLQRGGLRACRRVWLCGRRRIDAAHRRRTLDHSTALIWKEKCFRCLRSPKTHSWQFVGWAMGSSQWILVPVLGDEVARTMVGFVHARQVWDKIETKVLTWTRIGCLYLFVWWHRLDALVRVKTQLLPRPRVPSIVRSAYFISDGFFLWRHSPTDWAEDILSRNTRKWNTWKSVIVLCLSRFGKTLPVPFWNMKE